jgi:hypothetical protein
MKQITKSNMRYMRIMMVLGLLVISANVLALEPAYSRKGVFTGIGLGGGVSLPLGNDTGPWGTSMDPLGDIALDLQLGVGASKKVTIALNVDGRLEVSNDTIGGMVVPGPEVTVFIVKGFNVHAGIGVAITFWKDVDGAKVGMDAGAGLGYEFWVNTKWAAYMNIDFDYFLINEMPDLLTIGFWMGMRYY